MKRLLSVVVIVTVLLGVLAAPVAAKDPLAVVQAVIQDEGMFDAMYRLCKAIDTGDASDIFFTAMEITPDMTGLFKYYIAQEDPSEELPETAPASAGGQISEDEKNPQYVAAVRYLLRSQIFLDDMLKFTDTVSGGDADKIFLCVMEIYPDLVAQLKEGMETQGSAATASFLAQTTADFSIKWLLIGGICGLAMGAAVVFVIGKKKDNSAPCEPTT